MTPLPKLIKLLVMVTAAALFLSSAGMATAAHIAGPKPVWMLFGFELVVLVTSVLTLLFGLGRFQDGQGLAMATVSGTVAVASVLGWLSAGPKQHLVVTGVAEPISLVPWLGARLAAAALLALIGAGLVLSRDRRSRRFLAMGMAAGLPLVIALAAAVAARARIGGMLDSVPTWLQVVAVVVLSIIGIGLASASIHWLIKAFEMGRTEGREPRPL